MSEHTFTVGQIVKHEQSGEVGRIIAIAETSELPHSIRVAHPVGNSTICARYWYRPETLREVDHATKVWHSPELHEADCECAGCSLLAIERGYVSEPIEAPARRRGLCETCRDDLDFGGVMAHHCSECGR